MSLLEEHYKNEAKDADKTIKKAMPIGAGVTSFTPIGPAAVAIYKAIWNKNRNKHREYAKEKEREFKAIMVKYQSNPNLSIPITEADYLQSCLAYADSKRPNTNYTNPKGVLIDAALMVVGVAAIVIGVIFPPAEAAGWTIVATAVAGTIGAIAGAVDMAYKDSSMKKDAQKANRESSNRILKELNQAKEEQSNALTNTIIYAKYDIYAHQAIFLQGRAGTHEHNPTTAYDANKGLLGNKSDGEDIDKQIMLRSHADKAGNRGYYNNLMQVDMPLKTQWIDYKAMQERQVQILQKKNDIFMDFMREMVDTGWGAKRLHWQSVGVSDEIAQKQDRIHKQWIQPHAQNALNCDFLDKMQYYCKAVRLGLFAKKSYTKEELKNIKMQQQLEMIQNWNKVESIEKRKKYEQIEIAWLFAGLIIEWWENLKENVLPSLYDKIQLQVPPRYVKMDYQNFFRNFYNEIDKDFKKQVGLYLNTFKKQLYAETIPWRKDTTIFFDTQKPTMINGDLVLSEPLYNIGFLSYSMNTDGKNVYDKNYLGIWNNLQASQDYLNKNPYYYNYPDSYKLSIVESMQTAWIPAIDLKNLELDKYSESLLSANWTTQGLESFDWEQYDYETLATLGEEAQGRRIEREMQEEALALAQKQQDLLALQEATINSLEKQAIERGLLDKTQEERKGDKDS